MKLLDEEKPLTMLAVSVLVLMFLIWSGILAHNWLYAHYGYSEVPQVGTSYTTMQKLSTTNFVITITK